MSAPELHAEQEVDFRRYGAMLAARWWIVVVGVIVGVAVGYALAVGGGSVWKAQALLTLGQPYTPGSGAPVQSYGTNPAAVSEIVRSESALKQAARAADMHVGALRGHVSAVQTGTATGVGAARAVTLMEVTVQGAAPTRVAAAANALANIVVERTTAPYVGLKIATVKTKLKSLQARINTETQAVNALLAEANNKSLAPLDRLTLITQLNGAEQLLGTLQDEQNAAQQQLAFSQTVESARIVSPAAAVKSTARSRRSSMIVAGVIGLLLGALAALLWQPLAARFSRP